MSPRAGQRGAVLVLALMLVTVLAAVVLEAMHTLKVDITGTGLYRNRIQGASLAESGLRIAAAILAEDYRESGLDHRGEIWGEISSAGRAGTMGFATGALQGEIRDECGLFPVNSLNQDPAFARVLTRLLSLDHFGLSDYEAEDLVSALQDWIDPDSDPRSVSFYAENDYYAGLEEPYECRNGPMRHRSELLLVRGMSRELYAGDGEHPGLADLLTVHSNGRVNINTAPEEVLAALAGESVEPWRTGDFAEAAAAYRSNSLNWDALGDPKWYRALDGFRDVAIPDALITVRSGYFSLDIEARVGAVSKRMFAVLRRGDASLSGMGEGEAEGGVPMEILHKELR